MKQQTSNELLDSLKDKFDHVVVIGLTKGIVDVATTIPTYQFAQWMLNRAVFELLIAEKAQIVTPEQGPNEPPMVPENEPVNDGSSVS